MLAMLLEMHKEVMEVEIPMEKLVNKNGGKRTNFSNMEPLVY
jgi:hypothetical protein